MDRLWLAADLPLLLETTISMRLNGYDSEPLTEGERRYLAHYKQGRFAE
jgi:hypothetical protein